MIVGQEERFALSLLWGYLPCALLGDASFGMAKTTILGRREHHVCLADQLRSTCSAMDPFYQTVDPSLALADCVPWVLLTSFPGYSSRPAEK
jgi:hypothetical protein